MKFRIFDLIFLTSLIAFFIAAYQKDVTFFRQLLCFALITLASTALVLLLSKTSRIWKVGTVGGLLGGLIYLAVAYLFVFQLYETKVFVRQWIASDSVYYTWQTEALPVLVLAVFFGSAIGPLLALRIRKVEIPPSLRRPIWFSISLLIGMFLIGLLAMLDRFANFGDVRQILPLMVLALFVFVIHTHSWMNRLKIGVKGETERESAEHDSEENARQKPDGNH